MQLDVLDLDEVLDLEDHAADCRVVHLLDRAANLAEAQRLEGLALVGLVADRALDLRDTQRLFCVRQY